MAQHLFSILFVAVACVVTFSEAKELTEKNWNKRAAGKMVFVKFFAPWCGHCKKIKPDWDKLMSDFQGSPTALVAEVDCTAKGKSLCETFGVSGYPGLLWGKAAKLAVYEDSEEKLSPYTGAREYTAMKSFADDVLGESCGPGNLNYCPEKRRLLLEKFMKVPPDKLGAKIEIADRQIKRAEGIFKTVERNMTIQIQQAQQRKQEKIKSIREGQGLHHGPSEGSLELTPENWDTRVQGKTIFVKFFAPWCGHCKSMKPDWDRLMADFDGTSTALVAEVDCTAKGKPLCDKHSVTGFPRLMYGKGEKLSVYSGSRAYADLRRFADEHLGETCGPSSIHVCEESHKAVMEKLSKMSPEKRDAKVVAAEKAIEKAESEYFDTQWNMTGQIDSAEFKKDKEIKAIMEQGLPEAKEVHAWNQRQPPGFWKPPASNVTTPSLNSSASLFDSILDRNGIPMILLTALIAVLGGSLSGRLGSRSKAGKDKTCNLRHILTETEEAILEAKGRLDAGGEFGAVAAEFSACPSGKADGGALGVRTAGSFKAQELNEICFDPKTKLGEVIGPVQTQFGYHLLLIDSREGVREDAEPRESPKAAAT